MRGARRKHRTSAPRSQLFSQPCVGTLSSRSRFQLSSLTLARRMALSDGGYHRFAVDRTAWRRAPSVGAVTSAASSPFRQAFVELAVSFRLMQRQHDIRMLLVPGTTKRLQGLAIGAHREHQPEQPRSCLTLPAACRPAQHAVEAVERAPDLDHYLAARRRRSDLPKAAARMVTPTSSSNRAGRRLIVDGLRCRATPRPAGRKPNFRPRPTDSGSPRTPSPHVLLLGGCDRPLLPVHRRCGGMNPSDR